MAILTLTDSLQVFDDIIRHRLPFVRQLLHGEHHVAVAHAQLFELESAHHRRQDNAGPGPIPGLVQRHQTVARSIAIQLRAYLANPLAPPAYREAAHRILAATVEGTLGPAHAPLKRFDVAEAAARARPQIADDLALFAAPPGQTSLTELLDDWIEVGLAIGQAVSDLSNLAPAARPLVDVLRDAWLALTHLRKSVRLELEMFPELPRTLEAQVLGYADLLMKTRSAQNAKRRAKRQSAPRVAAR